MADELTRTQKLGQARNKATQRLVAEYQDEFNVLMKQEAEAVGEQWSPRKTDEDRAAEQVAKLLADFPHLAQQIAVTTGSVPTSPVTEVTEAQSA